MTLVTLHEFGHFLAAKRNGVRVLEFGIGFPPRAIAWVKDEKTGKWTKIPRSDRSKPQKSLIFSLNWLPIGGFCQMDGESAEDKRPKTFGAANFWQKTKILFAGVLMNWLASFVILTILAWTGMPVALPNQFTIENDTKTTYGAVSLAEIIADSPAETAGLKKDDIVLALNGEELHTATDVINYGKAHAGESVVYSVERANSTCDNFPASFNCQPTDHNSVQLTIPVQLGSLDAPYQLGASISAGQTRNYSTWSAPLVGAGLTVQFTGETFKGLGQLVVNLCSGLIDQLSPNAGIREEGQAALSAAGDSVSGPVGIIGNLFPSIVASGPTTVAFFAAIISVSLACMNVLPIPALDGGRWLLMAIFKLLKKPLKKETEEKIVSRAFIILLFLIVIITVLDIKRFF